MVVSKALIYLDWSKRMVPNEASAAYEATHLALLHLS